MMMSASMAAPCKSGRTKGQQAVYTEKSTADEITRYGITWITV